MSISSWDGTSHACPCPSPPLCLIDTSVLNTSSLLPLERQLSRHFGILSIMRSTGFVFATVTLYYLLCTFLCNTLFALPYWVDTGWLYAVAFDAYGTRCSGSCARARAVACSRTRTTPSIRFLVLPRCTCTPRVTLHTHHTALRDITCTAPDTWHTTTLVWFATLRLHYLHTVGTT